MDGAAALTRLQSGAAGADGVDDQQTVAVRSGSAARHMCTAMRHGVCKLITQKRQVQLSAGHVTAVGNALHLLLDAVDRPVRHAQLR